MGKELEILESLGLPKHWIMTNFASVIQAIDIETAKPFKETLDKYGITISKPGFLKYLAMNKEEQKEALKRIKFLAKMGVEITDENKLLVFDPVLFSVTYPGAELEDKIEEEQISAPLNTVETNEEDFYRYMDLSAKLRQVIEAVYFRNDVPDMLNDKLRNMIASEKELSDANILMKVLTDGNEPDEHEIDNLKTVIEQVVAPDIEMGGRN